MKLARILLLLTIATPAALADIVIGGGGASCAEDSACINRLHPEIPMVARARPGERIVLRGRDAADIHVDPDEYSVAETNPRDGFGVVHPLVGPVYIEGAVPGDVLAVTIEAIDPGATGWTSASPFGFAGDAVGTENRFIVWRLNADYAETDALPGIRIPNASFPGVIATMPGPALLRAALDREARLRDAGGAVYTPDAALAEPSSLCGEEGTKPGECLRTIPPRENGGNMDIRYMKVGSTVYLPCYIEGCGLAIGDFHYAQGDGEVSGTAIEMDADITVTTRVVRNGPDLRYGPHYEGPASLLSIPSSRFYATTGYPLKAEGEVPRDIAYLAGAKIADLPNLSKDLNLAAQNALVAMIDFISARYGYDRTQAYMIASVAVDLRIAQLVDVPNVGVTAILPLDIFVD
ncbi:MAG: acetamidase/formamidase family protein [Gammaproteobacteria bacterium]|nr:acetamidase/formamidase family protein [Gammaproteobacteria bacterium]MDH5345898.1 acetamidase/formamidase family protein [Gammaproteobacteria bacterium]